MFFVASQGAKLILPNVFFIGTIKEIVKAFFQNKMGVLH